MDRRAGEPPAPPPPPPSGGGGRGPMQQPIPVAPQPGLKVVTHTVPIGTEGNGSMVDLSPDISRLLKSVGMAEGNVTVFCPGSTASVSTIEFEPGLQRDVPEAMERIAPEELEYHHNAAWHDGNGHSHVRACIVGPSTVVPFSQGRLLLGTWQQVVLIDWDNKARRRDVILQFIGL